MDGNGKHHAGLLLANGEYAVADMLSPDVYDVAAPLHRNDPERQRQSRSRSGFADGISGISNLGGKHFVARFFDPEPGNVKRRQND